MIEPSKIAMVMLAAGSGTRFGGEKLDAMIDGETVGKRAYNHLEAFAWSHRFIIVPREVPLFARDLGALGVELVINEQSGNGLASSIALAVASVRETGVNAMLICLADMPFLKTATYSKLLHSHNASNEKAATAAQYSNGNAGPPVIFGSGWFSELASLSGDHGANSLLAADSEFVTMIKTNDDELVDIDIAGDLNAAKIL